MCRQQVAIMFAVLIVVCFLRGAVSKQCRKLDSALSKLCDYEYTVEFRHEKHFNSSLRALQRYTKASEDSCSEHRNLILCSYYLPRCEENIPGPYLPCRRVCDEYVKACGKSIMDNGLEWIVGTCQLLPKSDDPKTTKGYLGRCFEPPNFKPTSGDAEFKCWTLVEPLCQGLGYDKTVISEINQKLYSPSLKRFFGNYTADKKCGELTRQIVCVEFFQACKDNKVQYLCQNKCNKFFDTCESSLLYGKDMCIDFPNGNSSSGLCHQTHWPKYNNWPAPPTTTTTTGPRVTMTTRDEESSTESTSEAETEKPNMSSSRAAGACHQKWTIIIGFLVTFIFILLATVAFLAFLLYRKRHSRCYTYENRLYISGKIEEFEKR